MIKFIKLSAAVAGTVLLLAACTKNEPAVVNDNAPITFQTVTGKLSSKAMLDGTAYTSTDPVFGTAAYYLAAGNTWANSSASAAAFIPQSSVSWQPVTGVAGATEAWTTDIAYYWPSEGTLTFFSYSPYYVGGTASGTELGAVISPDNGVTLGDANTPYDVHANQTTDFMVAEYQPDLSANNEAYTDGGSSYTGVKTVFHHQLSQVVAFNVSTLADYSDPAATGASIAEAKAVAGSNYFTLKSIEILNVASEGYFVSGNTYAGTELAAKVWTVTGQKNKSYTWYEESTDATSTVEITSTAAAVTPNGLGELSYVLVLPQVFTEPAAPVGENSEQVLKIVYERRSYGQNAAEGYKPVTETITAYATLSAVHTDDKQVDADPCWELNKKITYNIVISLENNRILWAPSMENWDEIEYGVDIVS